MLKVVSVVGFSDCDTNLCNLAFEVGNILAKKGFVVASGGLTGVMEHALKGAKVAGGLTIGIIPHYEKEFANEYCDIVIPTGMGHARNIILVSTGEAVVSIGGAFGTMSEIAIALKMNKRVISFESPINHNKNFLDEEDFLKEIELL